MADRRQHVLHLPPLGVGVVDVVRDHDWQPELLGETGGLGHEPVVVGQQVVLHLQEERGRGRGVGSWPAAREEAGVALGRGPRSLPIPGPQTPGDLAFAAPGQRHDSVRVLGEERMAEARHRLGAGEIRPAYEAAQAAIPRRVPRQQDEMGTTLPLPDSPQILLHGVAVAGQSRAGRTWSKGRALYRQNVQAPDPRQRAAARKRVAATPRGPPWPPARQGDPRRIGHG